SSYSGSSARSCSGDQTHGGSGLVRSVSSLQSSQQAENEVSTTSVVASSSKAPRGSFKTSTKGGAKGNNKRGIRAVSDPMDTTEEQQDISLALAITDSIHQSIHALSQTQSEPSKRSFRTARLTRGLPPRVTRKTTRVAEATKKACLERQEGDREAIFDEERRKEHDQLPITIDDSSSINDQDTDYRPFSALTEADANASKNREAHTAAGRKTPHQSSLARPNPPSLHRQAAVGLRSASTAQTSQSAKAPCRQASAIDLH
ncbi:hypothetical protein N7448_008968, partial [Penicillium atrosanguineum]